MYFATEFFLQKTMFGVILIGLTGERSIWKKHSVVSGVILENIPEELKPQESFNNEVDWKKTENLELLEKK